MAGVILMLHFTPQNQILRRNDSRHDTHTAISPRDSLRKITGVKSTAPKTSVPIVAEPDQRFAPPSIASFYVA
jgi:hypothetical protein